MGNTIDTYRLEVKGEKKQWATLDKTYISVSSGESAYQEVNLTISIPSLANVRSPSDVEEGAYDFTVDATSRNDETVKNSLTVTLTVEKAYKLSIEKITEEDPVVADVNDPDGTVIRFKVINEGNTPDKVKISAPLIAPQGWSISVSPTSQVLDIDGEVEVRVTITFLSSPAPNPGIRTLKITATPNEGRERDLQVDASFNIDVRMPNLYVDSKNITLSKYAPTPNEMVVVTVKVFNTGNVNTETIVALNDNGNEVARKTVNVKASSSIEVQFDWKATVGSHKLQAEVDPTDSILETNDDDNSALKTLEVQKYLIQPSLSNLLVIALGVIVALLVIALLLQGSSRQRKINELLAEIENKPHGAGGAAAAKVEGLPKKEEVEKLPPKKEEKKAGKPETLQVMCPKCKHIDTYTVTERPTTVKCKHCGAPLIIH